MPSGTTRRPQRARTPRTWQNAASATRARRAGRSAPSGDGATPGPAESGRGEIELRAPPFLEPLRGLQLAPGRHRHVLPRRVNAPAREHEAFGEMRFDLRQRREQDVADHLEAARAAGVQRVFCGMPGLVIEIDDVDRRYTG